MQDIRGNKYTVGCEVVYRGADGYLQTGRIQQVIEIMGELIIDTFPLPVKATPGRFIIVLPKTPRTLFIGALDTLLQGTYEKKGEAENKYEALGRFVADANRALKGTPLWVRFDWAKRVVMPVEFDEDPPDYEGGRDYDIPNRCAVIPREQTSTVGSVGQGVGVALEDGHYVLLWELDGCCPAHEPEEYRDINIIRTALIKWFDETLKRMK